MSGYDAVYIISSSKGVIMQTIQKGFRDKLGKHLNLTGTFSVKIIASGNAEYDICCFGVDGADKLSDERYMVFFNQTSSPKGEITLSQSSGTATFNINLSALPSTINKLVFTVNIDGNSTMGDIRSLEVIAGDALKLSLTGKDFQREKAVIAMEIYKKDEWRISFIASGFNGGLSDLLRHYGGAENVISAAPKKPVTPTPAPSQPAPSVSLKKIELRKGQKVSLEKSASTGEILINLNWTQPAPKKGFFGGLKSGGSIDLDLACFVELENGMKYVVQALGNTFGSQNIPPYVSLDGDDRTGANTEGENLRINGIKINEIRRILIYTFIYEGVASWQEADGIVTIKAPKAADIVVHLDEYSTSQKMCAIASFERTGNTLIVEKIVRFFFGHQDMDQAFNWGFRWKVGHK
jgi:tellurite resistance protein TerA